MAKPNIRHLYSNAKLTGSRALRSVSPAAVHFGKSSGALQASYENVNLVNHLPFADKSVRDICGSSDRFRTLNQERTQSDAFRQSGLDCAKNLEANNSLNRFYKTRLLKENHMLGMDPHSHEKTVSEQRDTQRVIQTADAQNSIHRELRDKVNAQQLREENKKLVEAQNFKIQQPQLSGDVFDPNNYREKSRPLNGPSMLETINEGASLAKNYSQLSFKEKMIDQRKTNFNMGNEFLQDRMSRANLDSQSALGKYRTIDVNMSELDLKKAAENVSPAKQVLFQGS